MKQIAPFGFAQASVAGMTDRNASAKTGGDRKGNKTGTDFGK